MNLRYVANVLGLVLLVLAGAQLVPLAWSLQLADRGAISGFAVGAGSSGLVGVIMRWVGSSSGELYRREGVLIVVGSWLVASVAGAVPYFVSGSLPNPIDALFDKALISFDKNGDIMIGGKLGSQEKRWFSLNSSLKLRRVTDAHLKYLEHHNRLFHLKNG